MSIALTQAHGSVIYVNNANISFDAEVASGLPTDESGEVDLAVIGFADFVSGSYQQKTSAPNDITSTVSVVTDDLKNATFKLLTAAPTGATFSFSTIGDAIKDTEEGLVIQDASAIKPVGKDAVTKGSGAWFANLRTWAGTLSNVVDGANVLESQGMGAVLVQAAGAALFGRLGKNAAISNDSSIEAKQSALATAIAGTISETAGTNYNDSKMFKRYLDSGRYEADNVDVNASVDYNLDAANFDYIVQLQGSVADEDDVLTAAVVNRVLGTIGDGHHKVQTDLTYKMNIFMRIQQDDEL